MAAATARGRANLSAALLDANPALGSGAPALRGPGASWTYPDLSQATGRIAGWLDMHGIGRGDVVLIALADAPRWVALFLGAARVGAICALAGPRLGDEPLRALAHGLGPALVAHDGPRLHPRARQIGDADLDAIIDDAIPDPGPAAVGGADPCYLLLTSGTTGPSKWAVHCHADIRACIATYGRRVLRLRRGDVTWSMAALCSSYGLGNSLYFPLASGAGAWLDDGPPTPATAERACLQGGATALFGVPTGWARLTRHAREGRVDAGAFGGVRLAVSAGEALHPRVWHAVEQTLGLRLVDGLGCSEASNLYLSERPGSARPGSVGVPVPGFELRIAPDGELLVRGASVMSGYRDDPAATARALRDGWLHTGDLVARRPDGRYEFVGRRGERFKAGGLWVDPRRVTATLLGEPGVADAGVVGVADAEGVVRVVAVLADAVARPGLAERAGRRCEASLAPHERPRRILVVDELPVTGSGKVDRAALGRLAAAAVRQ